MIRLVLILLITSINITVAMLPFIGVFSLAFYGNFAGTVAAIKFTIAGILLIYSGYLLIDFVLGITMKIEQIRRKSYRFSGKYMESLQIPLSLVQSKYNMPHLKLLITDSEKIESYEMASMLQKYACLSIGMLNALSIRAKSPEEFQILSCVILAKKAYNLRSGNYLPAILFRNNTRVVKIISGMFGGIFKVFCFLIKYIPIIGPIISDGLTFVNKAISFVLNAVNAIFIKIYNIVDFITTIRIQTKGDAYAAKAIGGKYVAHAIGLTEEEIIRIFTFKPRLRKRIAAIENIEKTSEPLKIYPIYQVIYGIIIFGTFASTGYVVYNVVHTYFSGSI